MGANSSANVKSGPGAHPASCTMGMGSFPGVKRVGCGVDHPTSYSGKVKARVALCFQSPSDVIAVYKGNLFYGFENNKVVPE